MLLLFLFVELIIFFTERHGVVANSLSSSNCDRSIQGKIIAKYSNIHADLSIQIEEIFDFTQDDFIDRDVFILDCKDTIWVWFGKNSVPILQQLTLETLLVRTYKLLPIRKFHQSPIFHRIMLISILWARD